jgi:hypothetical protein
MDVESWGAGSVVEDVEISSKCRRSTTSPFGLRASHARLIETHGCVAPFEWAGHNSHCVCAVVHPGQCLQR